MIDGAGLFSHALSTHRAENEIDFFSAIEEIPPPDHEGAGHIGVLEFNSACYYRYIGLNLEVLADEKHLRSLERQEDRRKIVDTFLRASIMAVPTARKNSMFGFNPPEYVLGLVREGQPMSLINAFEKPISPSAKGYIEPSIAKMKEQHKNLKDNFGLKSLAEIGIPDKTLDDFCKELTGHVI